MDTRSRQLPDLSRYSINDHGQIFDIKLAREVKSSLNRDGYKKVTLRHDCGKRKTYSVHRLVALCFIENINEKPTVNHIDGNKCNNHFLNLEWATRSEQTQHAWDNGLIQNLTKRKEGIRALQGKAIECTTTGEVFNSLGAACERYNIKRTNLSVAAHSGLRLSCGKSLLGEKLYWRFI